MAVESFEQAFEEVNASKIVLSVFETSTGYLPYWEMIARDNFTVEELFALREGIELVRVQFDRLIDMFLSDAEEPDEGENVFT